MIKLFCVRRGFPHGRRGERVFPAFLYIYIHDSTLISRFGPKVSVSAVILSFQLDGAAQMFLMQMSPVLVRRVTAVRQDEIRFGWARTESPFLSTRRVEVELTRKLLL